MRLSLQAISDFKAIYQQKFGVELTDDEANLKGLEVLRFFQCIYRKVPKEDEQKLNDFEIDK